MASRMRRIRLYLRALRRIDARVGVPAGQSLVAFLGARRSYVNLLDAEWAGESLASPHAVVKLDRVLWASAPDGDVSLVGAAPGRAIRPVEIHVDGGLVLRGALALGDGQRLSDYLESQGAFLPLHSAVLLRSGPPPRGVNLRLGDVALNQDAIQAMVEVETLPVEADTAATA